MNQVESRNKSTFISRFRLDDRVLQKSDPKNGKASVTGAVERVSGNRVIIKQWRRSSTAGNELHEIWRQELRQLHRLSGYPGARQYIVPLLDSCEEEDTFFLVLDSGQKSPLQSVLAEVGDHHWLKQPRLEQNRLTIWANLARVACGLNLLHMQGLLHRNLDNMAIYTSGDDVPDFQLSGFEWSIRLSSNIRNSALPGSAISGDTYVHSFLQDWHAFGVMATDLLGVDPRSLLSLRTNDKRDVAPFLSGIERDLLLLLLRADPFSRIDGETVNSKISAILDSLRKIITKRDERLYLAPKLGHDSELSKAIRNASKRTIDVSDIQGQIDFIKNDLSESSQFVLSSPFRGAGAQQYFLFGRQLNYRLSPYRHVGGARSRSEPTWSVAYCESVNEKRPTASDIVAHKTLPGDCVDVWALPEISKKFVTLQGRTTRWDKQLEATENLVTNAEDLRQYRALLLVQILEALFVAAEIWPVSIHTYEEVDGTSRLRLVYRKDEEREKLAKALDLKSPSFRMRLAFTSEQWQAEEDWKLTDVGILGEDDKGKTDWTFVDAVEDPHAGLIYQFEGNGTRPLGDRLFLRRSSYVGTDKLLNRRATVLLALRDHAELLNAIRDPGEVVRPTHEKIIEDIAFESLDDSKKRALAEIWASIPLFLLQGPPGVGKTRLVRELVRRRLSEDTSARILLSAQSHDAIDHLLHEIQKDISGLIDRPIVIRAKPRDDKREKTQYDLPEQAKELAERISKSTLAARLPLNLKAKIDALLPPPTRSGTDEEISQRSPSRPLEALLLRGANLVFASTNAGDLERLIEEKAQFDWTIIEEAGKAMGPELLAPLLLSHRRLMIGDHKQLPPFGADSITRLLGTPENVSRALKIGESLVSWVFREAGLEEIVEQSAKPEEFVAVCGEAAAALMLFETLVTENLRPSKEGVLTTARQLLLQHRMHPAIATLVSDSFYGGDLKTHPLVTERFKVEAPPFSITDVKQLPASPIIFVDMPFVQSTMQKQEIEKKPKYHNPEEIEVVVQLLMLLRASGAGLKPSIAVLAPYREQVKRLKTKILKEIDGRLKHLHDFTFESDNGTPVGTVDSFQGNEADVVIVSLVRNNSHSGLKSLGFLADPRRMNVLLSRARHKLIIVGSHEFLTTRFTLPEQGIGTELDFLRRVLNSLGSQAKKSSIGGVPDVAFVSSKLVLQGVQK